MNGTVLNIYGMGVVAEDPETKTIGNRVRCKVLLAAYPEEKDAQWKRSLVPIDLMIKPGSASPIKGEVIVINSGTYSISQKTVDGAERKFTEIVAFSWRILPRGTEPMGMGTPMAAEPTVSTSLPPIPVPALAAPKIPASDPTDAVNTEDNRIPF